MKIYAGKNGRILPNVEGLIERPEVSEYNDKIKDIVSKFSVKGTEILFVFEPPLNDISGMVRVHYERSASGRFARAVCIEFPDREFGVLGKDFFKRGYRMEN